MKSIGLKKDTKQSRLWSLAKYLNSQIFRWTKGRIPGREEVEKNLKLLHTGSDVAKETEDYYIEKTVLLLKIVLAGLCITPLILAASWGETLLTDGYFLPRKGITYRTELKLKMEEGLEREVTVSVEPQKLSGEESRALLEKMVKNMDAYILGENRSLNEVRKDLNLIRQIEGTPVTLSWELGSYEVLNLDGSIRSENLKEEGSLVELTAVLTCNEETAVYQTCVKVLPPVLSAEEVFMQELQQEIERFQQESGEKERQELPAQVQGKPLIWQEKKPATTAAFVLLLILCVGFVYTGKDRELKKKTQEREMQMRRDYARIVSKLVLLMSAGSTIRHAWDLMVRDYLDKRETGQEVLRYAYEEMTLTSREMQNGIAEAKAYENFGIRCRISCYLKLSALLEQNLTKGSRGLSVMLNTEVQEAFEQRKELARCRGEETTTRMLLPMILLLVVVMIIILVPAGMAMGG